jgi:site-specific DNA recombinase
MAVVASIYVRISQARDGSTLGVERQLPPALAVCRRKGWRVPAIETGHTLDDLLEAIRHGRPVEGIYVDNDLSAYDRSKPRKDYQRLLTDIAAGQAGAIAAFDIDRLTRDMREGEDIIDLARTYGTRTAFATGEDYDLSTPGGRYAFRGEVNRAVRESDQKSLRAKLKHDELGRAGRFSGYRRPFGYDLEGIEVERERPDGTPVTHLINCRLVINVAEAHEIRAAVKRLNTGGTVSSIMADWNRRGIRRAEGGIWYTRNIVALLTNPRIAGLRRWQGELYQAEWEAIIAREEWERVCLIMANPAPDPRRGRRGPPPTIYLLTGGLGACECGASIRVMARAACAITAVIRRACLMPAVGSIA